MGDSKYELKELHQLLTVINIEIIATFIVNTISGRQHNRFKPVKQVKPVKLVKPVQLVKLVQLIKLVKRIKLYQTEGKLVKLVCNIPQFNDLLLPL